MELSYTNYQSRSIQISYVVGIKNSSQKTMKVERFIGYSFWNVKILKN